MNLAVGQSGPAAGELAERIAADRAARGRALRERLRELAPLVEDGAAPPEPEEGESPPGLALLSHALYEIQRACEARDAGRLREAFELAADDVPGNRPLVADASCCHRTEDPAFDSTVYTLRPGAPPSARRDLVRGAVARIDSAGHSRWLEQGLGALVLCDRAHAGRPAFSYSVGALPYTVFSDWADDPIVLGESLVHESAHCWLNAALAAEGERLPPAPLLHSPWKAEPRPPFALLHAGLAFSVVATYFRAQLADVGLSDEEREYCEMRAGLEERRVGAAREGIGRALGLVGSASLREAVERQISMVAG